MQSISLWLAITCAWCLRTVVTLPPGIVVNEKLKFNLGPSEKFCIYEELHAGNQLYTRVKVESGSANQRVGYVIVDPSTRPLRPYSLEEDSEADASVYMNGIHTFCVDNPSLMRSVRVIFHIVAVNLQQLEDSFVDGRNTEETVKQIGKRFGKVWGNILRSYVSVLHMRETIGSDEAMLVSNSRYVDRWSLMQCVVTVLSGGVQLYFMRRMFERSDVTPSGKRRA